MKTRPFLPQLPDDLPIGDYAVGISDVVCSQPLSESFLGILRRNSAALEEMMAEKSASPGQGFVHVGLHPIHGCPLKEGEPVRRGDELHSPTGVPDQNDIAPQSSVG